ncbi:hypothetical protein INS49_004041 [Diaporthe citri]|uniref:uncharacterized protein n=1 Tax=Diaporthe citri TaxID=83186 RepID=UPI001C7FFC3D|nr:uncharacterized protein INS49_004041 [Diaporthe citri]KAG6354960.1 hypothetical protein INS49_004041 [Diaporthe citri]
MATSVVVTEEQQDAIALRSLGAIDDDTSASLVAQQADDAPAAQAQPPKLHPVLLTAQLAGVNLLSSVVNGYITVGLPRIAADLSLPEELFFWPASVYGLAIASTLLLAGSVADILGTRAVDLSGCFALAASILGSGFVRTGVEFIVLRVIQGVAMSLHLSSSVAIVAGNMPQGRIDTIGWRAGWFIDGDAMLLLFMIGLRVLPKSKRNAQGIMAQLATKVDWVGAIIASAFFACLSYLLAIISTDVYRIHDTETIVLISIAAAALPAFLTWVHYRVKVGKPALMPNKIWKNKAFSTVCLAIFISFGVLNSMEQYSSLFFQEVQQLPALQASIRILPSLIVGVALNLSTGLIVDKISALWLVVGSSVLCAIAPLLMALVQPQWPYWYNAFFAQILMPISGDVLFTIGLIVVSNVFPEDTQSLAGAVFNTAAQFGSSLGLTVMQVVSTLTAKGQPGATGSPEHLMAGYRATFWTMFALMVSCAFVSTCGLRRAGKVGAKRD